LSDAPVHLNASPSVHPSVAQRFCEHSNPTVRLLGLQLAETLETAYDRLGRLDSEIGEIKANRDLSAEGKHRRIAETRKAARAEAKETIAKLRERVARAIERERTKLEEGAREPAGQGWARDIHDYVRALPNSAERMGFVAAQAEKGNRDVVSAVLGCPHRFLTGLDDVPEKAFQEFRQKVLGALDRERASTVEALEGVQRAVRDAIAGCDWEDRVAFPAFE
jgi:hypothetical protein